MHNSPQPIFPLHLSPLDTAAAADILTWKYPPPYEIYNLSNPDPRLTKSAVAYLLDPANQFYQMVDSNGRLAAFCSYGQDGQVPGGDYSQPALDIGMGIHPDLTGRGWGSVFAETAVSFAQRTFHPPKCRVTIATFNLRAQKVWQKIGFTPTVTFHSLHDDQPFIIMEKALP